jgi:hypothetical protein
MDESAVHILPEQPLPFKSKTLTNHVAAGTAPIAQSDVALTEPDEPREPVVSLTSRVC